MIKISKEVILGSLAGLVLGIPQGLRDLPNISEAPKQLSTLYGVAGFGFLGGILIGMHLLSRANPNPKKHAGFAFVMVGSLSIGIPTMLRHFDGAITNSFNMQSAFFTSIGLAAIIGGVLSGIASKNT